MAGISTLNQFPCRTLSANPPSLHFISKTSLNSFGFTARKAFKGSYSISVRELTQATPVFRARASIGEEFDAETGLSATAVAEPTKELTEIDLLKKQLLETFYGTYRGLNATCETRAEIAELIAQIEAKNPNPAPTEALTLLNGKWILEYTSYPALYPLLSSEKLSIATVELSQSIDSENFAVQNSVLFSGPYASTSISTNATFEIRSPARVQIKFEEGVIGTPQLTDSIELPESVEILGQNIDLSPFKSLITSVQDTASSVAKTISSQPPLKFSISHSKAESWLLTTYLDDELRISRGDGGSVFVLVKEGSSLSLP